MRLYTEKRDLLQSPDQQSLYDTALLCGRYLKNRALSVSKRIKLTSSYPNGGTSSTSGTSKSSSSSPTAYLSGVRGLASISVFIFHATWAYSSIVDRGYGLSDIQDGNQNSSQDNYHFIQLPFVRLIHAGHAMVALFFVIGGYVNAVKPLRLIRARRHAELTTAVGSSLLRRVIRLYLPAATAMLCTALLVWIGLFEPSRRNLEAQSDLFFYPDFHPARYPTLSETLADWWTQLLRLLIIGPMPYWQHLDPHLWTVPMELRASLILAVALAAVACCTVCARLCIIATLTIISVRWDRWEVALFLAGAILAELDLIRQAKSSPNNSASASLASASLGLLDEDDDDDDENKKQRMPVLDHDLESAPLNTASAPTGATGPLTALPSSRRVVANVANVALVLAGLYLLSAPPAHSDKTPGYRLLSWLLIPSWTSDGKRYVTGVGAVLFLAALARSPAMQRPLVTAIPQYLGTISYSFYIVHGPVLHSVGYVVGPAVLARTGSDAGAAWVAGITVAIAVPLVVSLAVAHVFYRVVDVGSVRVAGAFERLCSAP